MLATQMTLPVLRYPALKGGLNLIACVSNPPVDEESGWPVNYDYQYVGGYGYDLEFHPYWQACRFLV